MFYSLADPKRQLGPVALPLPNLLTLPVAQNTATRDNIIYSNNHCNIWRPAQCCKTDIKLINLMLLLFRNLLWLTGYLLKYIHILIAINSKG